MYLDDNDATSPAQITGKPPLIKCHFHMFGIVQAWVGQNITIKLILRLFVTIFYIQWASDVMGPSTKHKQSNLHCDHGCGVACPPSGEDLMNLHNAARATCPRSWLIKEATCKLKEKYFLLDPPLFLNEIAHPSLTMVAKMASIAIGRSP